MYKELSCINSSSSHGQAPPLSNCCCPQRMFDGSATDDAERVGGISVVSV